MSRSSAGRLLPLALVLALPAACSPRAGEVDRTRADVPAADSALPAAAADSVGAAPRPVDPTAGDDDQPQYQPGKDPWAASRARGTSFRGIGQEPGWIVEVFPGDSLVALLDYGERTIRAPWSEPRRAPDGAVTFTSTIAAGELVVRVTPVACADGMSGERMTHTVVLRYGNREYHGCGRVLSDAWPAR